MFKILFHDFSILLNLYNAFLINNFAGSQLVLQIFYFMVGGAIKLEKLHLIDIYLIQFSLINSPASKFM